MKKILSLVLCALMTVAAFTVEQGNTPVHPGQDLVPDRGSLIADDLYLCPAGAQEHDLVQRHRNDDDQQNAVEQVFQGMEEHLAQQNAEIKGPQTDRYGNVEELS